MVQKRPAEEFGDGSLKQPRYLKLGDEMVSTVGLGENVAQRQHNLGDNGCLSTKDKHQCFGRPDNCHMAELLTCTDKEIEPGSLSNSPWATSTTSEEDNGSEAAFRILLTPDYYNLEDPVSIIIHPRDVCYSLLEYPSQKVVSFGKEFQAEIPEWDGVGGSEKSSSSFTDACESSCLPSHTLESDILCSSKKDSMLAGTCVIPMPELDIVGNVVEKPGSGRTDCSCEDVGSVRCVKQHIGEARLNLRLAVGTETFDKLGFDDMGEVVAERWSEEEKEIFHEVVFSNPDSMGMNFWDQLASAFPERIKKEIVSFYFNVFILRKRAEQNRCNLSSIDSDNDECEETDLSADEAVGKINEDDDSLSELQEHVFVGHDIYEENLFENHDVFHANSKDDANENFSGNGVINYVPEPIADVEDNSNSYSSSQVVSFDETDCTDVQNCLSSLCDRGGFDVYDVQNGAPGICDRGDPGGPNASYGTNTVHFEGESAVHDAKNVS